MTEELTRLRTDDGFELAVSHSRGSGQDVVIWMHGIAVDQNEYLNFFRDGASYLAAAGFGSIRFDFRGHGHSSGKPSDFSIIGQMIDAKAVCEFAFREYPAGTRFHMVGASFGAAPAIFGAARFVTKVRRLALIAPVLSYRRTFLEPETPWAQELFSPSHIEAVEGGGHISLDATFSIGLRLVEEMRVVRPDLALRETVQPVLIFHGDRDSMVPYEATVEASQGLGQVHLISLHGVDHGFMIAGDDEGVSGGSVETRATILRGLASHFEC